MKKTFFAMLICMVFFLAGCGSQMNTADTDSDSKAAAASMEANQNDTELYTVNTKISDVINDKTTPRLIQFHTLKNAVNPPFLGGFSIFSTVAAWAERHPCQ